MQADRPSQTAWLAALARARHQIIDDGKVFRDPLALRVLGPAMAAELTEAPRRAENRLARGFRLPLAARSRIVEDTLHTAVQQGVRQCVVLGAGLDTLGCRQPHAGVGLRVFEVDFPATQAWKRRLLAEAGLAEPADTVFVPVDFERDDFIVALQQGGWDAERPTVFSWLGVTVYLTPPIVLQTLQRLRDTSAPGSVVVFDYVSRPPSLAWLRRGMLALLSRRYARMGEPWRCFMDDRALLQSLQAMGYCNIDVLRPADVAQELMGQARSSPAARLRSRFGGVVRASVPQRGASG